MANITLRTAKGSPLTNLEVDGNFTAINTELGTATTTLNAASATTSNNTIVKRDASGNFSSNEISATNFNTTSDINAKDNIVPLSNSIAVLNQINPVSFDWKSNGKKSYGVIAQELEKVLPELVNSSSSGSKSVSYIPLIALLIDAVQELSGKVAELEQQKS